MSNTTRLIKSLFGLISALSVQPAMAELNLQLGLVGSANSSIYKNAENEYYALPLIIAQYDRFYLQGTHGGYRFYRNQNGQSLALEIRRTFDGYASEDSTFLRNMAEREGAWEAGLAIESPIKGGLAKLKFFHDISDEHDGLSLHMNYERPLLQSHSQIVSWYIGSEYWDRKKSRYYLGVSPEEARIDRPIYSPGDSYSISLGTNAFRQLTDSFTLMMSAEYQWLSAETNDSPITGRRDQWSAYAGVFHRF